jgi:hypothetical protein
MRQSHLISEAKQSRAWLVVGGKKDLQRRLLRDKQFGEKGGKAIKVQKESLVPDLSKVTKAERKWFLCMCSYLSLKPFQTQTRIFGFLLK